MTHHSTMIKRVGWSTFIKSMQHPSDINPTIAQVAHTAATYLHRLAKTGIPAPSLSAPWCEVLAGLSGSLIRSSGS